MITLKKENIVMEVATELQASVFLRNGYVRVEPEEKAVEKQVEAPAKEVEPKPEKAEAPKKRTRKKAE